MNTSERSLEPRIQNDYEYMCGDDRARRRILKIMEIQTIWAVFTLNAVN